jgi:hypothetical protein
MNKKEIKKLDDLWSRLVKLSANNKCEYCGKTNNLNSHHVYSRSNRTMRWLVDNGICLCVAHHTLSNFSAHKSPIDFIEYMKTLRGETWYNELKVKAKGQVIKQQFSEIESYLKNLEETLIKILG